MDREAQLNKFWLNVSCTVREGDFVSYKKNYHEDAVYISETTQSSVAISAAFTQWQQSFDDTKKERVKVDVQFKFTQRIGTEKTAFEKGIFLYTSTDKAGLKTIKFMGFEAVLVKRKQWQILLEHQKSESNESEWNLLVT
mgnify:CR=1 FL=1|jgi:ketosteroid isomerase-like protein